MKLQNKAHFLKYRFNYYYIFNNIFLLDFRFYIPNNSLPLPDLQNSVINQNFCYMVYTIHVQDCGHCYCSGTKGPEEPTTW